MVEYWPEKGRSGLLVWKFRFRRDDPAPAPWSDAGKRIIEQRMEGPAETFEAKPANGTENSEQKESKKRGQNEPRSKLANDKLN